MTGQRAITQDSPKSWNNGTKLVKFNHISNIGDDKTKQIVGDFKDFLLTLRGNYDTNNITNHKFQTI